MGVVSLVGVVTVVTSASIGAVVSVSKLVEELKESSVPPHEMIVRLTMKMKNMTIIFFTFSSKIFSLIEKELDS